MAEVTEVNAAPPAPIAPVPDPRVALLESNIKLATDAAEAARKLAEDAQAEKAKLQAAAAETTAALQLRLVRSETKARAIQSGIVNADLADTLPITAATVGADGTLAGIDEQVAAWKQRYPQIFEAQRSSAVSPVAPVPAAPSTAAPAPLNVRSMSKADYAAWLTKASAEAATRERAAKYAPRQ